MATTRNRIIYQSQALFIAPSSSGYHIQTGAFGDSKVGASGHGSGMVLSRDEPYNLKWSGSPARVYNSGIYNRSLLEPLERIQSANFNFTINRQDINEFGQLARLDSIVMESPTVGLDFNYYLTDGGNERKMGFNVPTSTPNNASAGRPNATTFYWSGDGCISGYSALSGVLNDPQGNNYFITVVPDGEDVEGQKNIGGITDFDVVCIGNGFVSDYTVEASVGSIPTASVTVEGFNIKVDDRLSGSASTFLNTATQQNGAAGGNIINDEGVPGVTLEGTSGTNRYVFQTGVGNTGAQYGAQGWTTKGKSFNVSGDAGVAALRPGDLTFSMSSSGDYIGLTDMDGDGAAHIQSFTISVPLSRTVLQRLGSTFGYARVVDLPVDISCTVSAIVSELQKKNLFSELCSKQVHNFTLRLADSTCTTAGKTKLTFTVKNARLDSETFTNAIGDNESVDMSFTAQIGGANDQSNGLFMDGSYPRFRTLPYWPLGQVKDDDSAYKGDPVSTNPY
jgi:hypothetical protein